MFVEWMGKRKFEPRRGGMFELISYRGFKNISLVIGKVELLQELQIFIAK